MILNGMQLRDWYLIWMGMAI